MKTVLFLRLGLALILIGILSTHLQATSWESAESQRVHNLAIIIESYSQQHSGQLPASWDELNTFGSISGLSKPPIQERYTLAPNAPISAELDDAQVLAIGRIPFSDDIADGIGRFVIFRTKDGLYQSGWYLEDKIQKIIAETHLEVPPQTVPQPVIPPRPPHEPMTREQYELLKRSGLLSPHEAITIIDSSNAAPANPAVQTSSGSSTSTSGALSKPAFTPKTVAEVSPASKPIIAWWIYAIVTLSLCLIGSLWYFLRSKK